MSGIELNKIFAAILLAGISAMLAGFVADLVVKRKTLDGFAYPVEGLEGPVSIASSGPQGPEPVLHLLAGADPERGAKVARQCASCHNFQKGDPNRSGPVLWDVVGRHKAGIDNFRYSDTLEAMENRWTFEALNHFIWKPKDYAPGTSMNYIGLKKAEDRAALIAWLRTLSDSPHPLPDPAALQKEEHGPGDPEAEGKETDNPDTQKPPETSEEKTL